VLPKTQNGQKQKVFKSLSRRNTKVILRRNRRAVRVKNRRGGKKMSAAREVTYGKEAGEKELYSLGEIRIRTQRPPMFLAKCH